VGDAFDFAYKSNLKNLRIYEQSLYAGHADTARHWGFLVTILLGVAAVVGGVMYGLIALVRSI